MIRPQKPRMTHSGRTKSWWNRYHLRHTRRFIELPTNPIGNGAAIWPSGTPDWRRSGTDASTDAPLERRPACRGRPNTNGRTANSLLLYRAWPISYFTAHSQIKTIFDEWMKPGAHIAGHTITTIHGADLWLAIKISTFPFVQEQPRTVENMASMELLHPYSGRKNHQTRFFRHVERGSALSGWF